VSASPDTRARGAPQLRASRQASLFPSARRAGEADACLWEQHLERPAYDGLSTAPNAEAGHPTCHKKTAQGTCGTGESAFDEVLDVPLVRGDFSIHHGVIFTDDRLLALDCERPE